MVSPFVNANWAFGFVNWLSQSVQESYRADAHKWPMLRNWSAEAYQAAPGVRLLIIRDQNYSTGMPTIHGMDNVKEWPPGAEHPSPDILTSPALLGALSKIYAQFSLRQQDIAFLISENDGNSVEDSWNLMGRALQESLRMQLGYVMRNQLYYVRGLDTMGSFVIPPGYEFLMPECRRFLDDHPSYEKNVFLMTRFDSTNKFSVKLDQELRTSLRSRGYNPVRADDKMYMPDRNLWNGVCVYMLCSSRGIAVLEDRVADEFNPNVALEYGFMRALNKPALLLADTAFRNLRADIVGTLRETFDLTDIEGTVQPAIERWLRD